MGSRGLGYVRAVWRSIALVEPGFGSGVVSFVFTSRDVVRTLILQWLTYNGIPVIYLGGRRHSQFEHRWANFVYKMDFQILRYVRLTPNPLVGDIGRDVESFYCEETSIQSRSPLSSYEY